MQWQYVLQYTQHILPQHSNNFNYVFLLIISTKTVTLARFRRMLPDDDPNGPKHVGAIYRDILTISCSILCFNKECIFFGKKALNLSKCTVKQQLKLSLLQVCHICG
jgi:hypothetical protein